MTNILLNNPLTLLSFAQLFCPVSVLFKQLALKKNQYKVTQKTVFSPQTIIRFGVEGKRKQNGHQDLIWGDPEFWIS